MHARGRGGRRVRFRNFFWPRKVGSAPEVSKIDPASAASRIFDPRASPFSAIIRRDSPTRSRTRATEDAARVWRQHARKAQCHSSQAAGRRCVVLARHPGEARPPAPMSMGVGQRRQLVVASHHGAQRRLARLAEHIPQKQQRLTTLRASPVAVSALEIIDVKCYTVGTRQNGEQLMVGNGRALIIVKVETSAGFHGWGEAGLLGRELAVAGAVEHYRQLLVGRDARRIGASWQEMYRSQYFEGGRVLTAAISAIDMALHDAVARSLEIPVYMLLGGAQRDRVPCFGTALKDSGGPGMIEEAQQLVAEGFDCIRLVYDGTKDSTKVFEPREAIATTAALCIAAREALGPAITLGLEWHHRLSVAEAASFCHKLPPGTVDWVEEIIRDETPESYEQLRRMVDIPFAIGEEFSSKWVFLPYVERGILEFARLDLGNVGGFTEAMKVAGLCEAHYIDMMPHNPCGPIMTAANLHFAAAVPNYAWLEDRPEYAGNPMVFPKQPQRSGMYYELDDSPGLGVEVNEDWLEEAAVEGYNFGSHAAQSAAGGASDDVKRGDFLRRRDGSYTNS